MKQKIRVVSFVFVSVFAALLIPQRAAASDNSTYITIQKGRLFDQISSSSDVADPVNPFTFSASGNSALTMSFTPPGGSSTPVTTSQNNNSPEYDQSFTTQGALDTAFPDGSYTLSVTGSSPFMLALTGDLYPSAPQIVGGTWNSSGQLVIDPTSSYTMNFSSFPGYSTNGAAGHMQISLSTYNGNSKVVNNSALSSSSQAVLTSAVIASGTLQPGSIYQGELDYATATQFNSTSVSGYTAVTLYQASTYFTVVTSGTPSNPPVITQQPTNQTAPLGGTATFQIGMSNGNNIEVQWFRNGIAINQNSGTSSLTISDIQSSDLTSYFCILANSNGAYVQSNTVTLSSSASAAPSITGQPSSITVATGSTAVFNVTASGSPVPTYQWMFNGAPISGATTSTLVVSGSSSANAGSYTCAVTNGSGSVTSSAGVLTVEDTTTPGHLINIAARSFVGTGGNVLIAGFVVQGSSALPVLVRSSGPALTSDGVSGVLSDPELQLYSGSNNFATNAGWGGNALITSTASAVGASPWNNPSSLDSALLESLNPGAYTGITSGASGDTGVSLAEVYDATPSGTYTSTSPHLINIAARAFVGTGGNVLIAGFVIGGSTSKTVLIRASGPALIPDGVTGVLSDPQVQLYSGSSVIASNAGWGGNAQIVSVANSVGASAWSNPSSLDSALLVTLPPGGYTAIISGVSGDSGVALAEVYDVR